MARATETVGTIWRTLDELCPQLERVIVAKDPPKCKEQHLCLDKGYDNPTSHTTVTHFGYLPHIRRIGEEKLDAHGELFFAARHWVVKRTLSWLSKCRALPVRYDKKVDNFLVFLKLACALLGFRHLHRLSILR
jgi:putative transposase